MHQKYYHRLFLSTGAQAALIVDDFSVDSSFINAPGGETNTINSDFSVDLSEPTSQQVWQ
jgi:hypothetical protein